MNMYGWCKVMNFSSGSWRRGGWRPASEPGLAWHPQETDHLPLHPAHRSSTVDHTAWRQERGDHTHILNNFRCNSGFQSCFIFYFSNWATLKWCIIIIPGYWPVIDWSGQLNHFCFYCLFVFLSDFRKVLPHHFPWRHFLDCFLLLPDGLVGSPGRSTILVYSILLYSWGLSYESTAVRVLNVWPGQLIPANLPWSTACNALF